MTKTDVFNFFAGGNTRGAHTAVAAALGKTVQAVHRWKEDLPECVQYEIEVKSHYQLQSQFTKERLKGKR